MIGIAGRALVFALTVLGLTAPARAEPLVAALSTPMVTITSNFTGTEVTVFGAIDETVAMPAAGWNVVVALAGPSRAVTVRRKEPVAGLWINRGAHVYSDVPVFYALASTLPIDMVTTPETAARLRLGLSALSLGDRPETDAADFHAAVLRLQQKAKRFAEYPTSVAFLGRRLFATTIPIPAEVPVGHYEARVVLFADRAPVAEHTVDLMVVKSGFEQGVADLATRWPIGYGLLSVTIALLTGWLGGVLFRRD